ncbi:MAG: hypothetical protein WBQ44_13380, partial [Rhodococcus sp. (in: high G+C Gram-positive bacteria)]
CDDSFTFYQNSKNYCDKRGDSTFQPVTYHGNSAEECSQTCFNVVSSMTGYCDADNNFVAVTPDSTRICAATGGEREAVSKWAFCAAMPGECQNLCACRKTYGDSAFCVRPNPNVAFTLYNESNLNEFCSTYANANGLIVKKLSDKKSTDCARFSDASGNDFEPHRLSSLVEPSQAAPAEGQTSQARYRRHASYVQKVAAAVNQLDEEQKRRVLSSLEHSKGVLNDITSELNVSNKNKVAIDNSTNFFIDATEIDPQSVLDFIAEMMQKNPNIVDASSDNASSTDNASSNGNAPQDSATADNSAPQAPATADTQTPATADNSTPVATPEKPATADNSPTEATPEKPAIADNGTAPAAPEAPATADNGSAPATSPNVTVMIGNPEMFHIAPVAPNTEATPVDNKAQTGTSIPAIVGQPSALSAEQPQTITTAPSTTDEAKNGSATPVDGAPLASLVGDSQNTPQSLDSVTPARTTDDGVNTDVSGPNVPVTPTTEAPRQGPLSIFDGRTSENRI